MKKYIFISIVFLFLGCSNSEVPSLQSELLGEWQWIESSGGIAGVTHTPESTGEEHVLIFRSNTVKKYINNTLVSETNYSIEQVDSSSGERVDLFVYDDGGIDRRIQLDGNYLILYDYNVSDGFQYEYQRK